MIYIFNLTKESESFFSDVSKFEIDMFLEIDSQWFGDEYRLGVLCNKLQPEHQKYIDDINQQIKMMEVRIRFNNGRMTELLRIDSESKLTREILTQYIQSVGDLQKFTNDHYFNRISKKKNEMKKEGSC